MHRLCLGRTPHHKSLPACMIMCASVHVCACLETGSEMEYLKGVKCQGYPSKEY